MISRTLPPQDYLKQCFDYDPESGVLRWRARPREHYRSDRVWKMATTAFSGRACAKLCDRGYLGVSLDGHNCLVHRIAWKMMTGEDPETVDHRNHITGDNRFENLRAATKAENTRHMHGHKDRKYPGALKGAYRHKAGWLAFVGIGGKQKYIGVFKTEQEAHDAYCAKAKELHGEFLGPQ